MTQPQLISAWQALQAGNRPQALQLVEALLQQQPTLVQAWLLLAEIHTDPRQRRTALERAIALDPTSQHARQQLAALPPEPAPTLLAVPAPLQPQALGTWPPAAPQASPQPQALGAWPPAATASSPTPALGAWPPAAAQASSSIQPLGARPPAPAASPWGAPASPGSGQGAWLPNPAAPPPPSAWNPAPEAHGWQAGNPVFPAPAKPQRSGWRTLVKAGAITLVVLVGVLFVLNLLGTRVDPASRAPAVAPAISAERRVYDFLQEIASASVNPNIADTTGLESIFRGMADRYIVPDERDLFVRQSQAGFMLSGGNAISGDDLRMASRTVRSVRIDATITLTASDITSAHVRVQNAKMVITFKNGQTSSRAMTTLNGDIYELVNIDGVWYIHA